MTGPIAFVERLSGLAVGFNKHAAHVILEGYSNSLKLTRTFLKLTQTPSS